ncbi:hypothetical protein T03_11117 [Trichinella britovi]|uniref:Uncharacterized protein n=1 Tax=Trichinella britovi TaxID=45882 RepID=A0A0V1CT94_TRIBR|nr:hypothetical protein T03_11117 [Trichinella britovi]
MISEEKNRIMLQMPYYHYLLLYRIYRCALFILNFNQADVILWLLYQLTIFCSYTVFPLKVQSSSTFKKMNPIFKP